MTLSVRTATSTDEARRLLAGSPLPVDSPTQARIRTPEHLDQTLAAGRRRPEWTWVAEYDGQVAGIVGGLGSPRANSGCWTTSRCPPTPTGRPR